MSASHQSEAAIFDAAMELPPEQRSDYIDEACGEDAALRRRVESLLKASESQCVFLDSPAQEIVGTGTVRLHVAEKPGETFGRYKLAFALPRQGLYDEAEKTAPEAVMLSRKIMGDAHVDVAISLATLANVLADAKRPDEAEPYARQALAMFRQLLGSGHYETTMALNKLAIILEAQNKSSEAEVLMREALATQRKVLGERHPELVLSLRLLAGSLADESKLPEVELLLREALAMVKRLQGDKYPL